MTETMNPLASCHPRAERLVELAKWLTREERKRRLGQPSEWDQEHWVNTYDPDDGEVSFVIGGEVQPPVWSCHTSCCAAGHISLEDGGRPAVLDGTQARPWRPGDNGEMLSEAHMVFGGQVESIEQHASNALRLSIAQTDLLFAGGNDWGMMIETIAAILEVPDAALIMFVGGDHLPPDPDDDDDYYDY